MNNEHHINQPTNYENNQETGVKNEHEDEKENPKGITDELTEGKLYKLENGELIELVIDPDELRKVKITDDAIKSATEVQKKMRKILNGFKPDITTVCSALIKAQANKPDATKVVSNYWLEKAQLASSVIESEG
ncbi:hypothetical protein DS885_03870 [Psychromonas sp. B3M02]|uniref:hypothetical protein n=1 Tax=Psychromonas sp. B3M02 TaxID=2267226 RepID=UPI000DE97C8E|nr:hypothetical protein [Psychromonas sp. B3M02]RBW47294.1 hypothetical protein DS885_03870 [Psychromonas sp. B3M02]